ncbi:MAG: putative quinol monooxygenase [Jatrophihabitans sp.]|uniref:putative quinol monooxygenase n=1 Tax=Jatrophihabitans sp. TaxID=1932789 RepID=UPI003F7E50A7
MSLPVVAVITAKPGTETVLRDALVALAAASRDEEGCLAYEVLQSTTDATVFVTVEDWRDQADLQAHMHSAHMQQAMAAAGDAFAGAPVIHTLTKVG